MTCRNKNKTNYAYSQVYIITGKTHMYQYKKKVKKKTKQKLTKLYIIFM